MMQKFYLLFLMLFLHSFVYELPAQLIKINQSKDKYEPNTPYLMIQEGHTDAIASMTFNTKGDKLLTLGGGIYKFWDAFTGKLIWEKEIDLTKPGTTRSPDGKFIFEIEKDNYCIVQEIVSDEPFDLKILDKIQIPDAKNLLEPLLMKKVLSSSEIGKLFLDVRNFNRTHELIYFPFDKEDEKDTKPYKITKIGIRKIFFDNLLGTIMQNFQQAMRESIREELEKDSLTPEQRQAYEDLLIRLGPDEEKGEYKFFTPDAAVSRPVLAFTNDLKKGIVLDTLDNALLFWDLENDKPISQITKIQASTKDNKNDEFGFLGTLVEDFKACISPDDKYIAFTENGGASGNSYFTIKIWSIERQELINENGFKIPNLGKEEFTFSNDKKYMISADLSNYVKVWDFEKAKIIASNDAFVGMEEDPESRAAFFAKNMLGKYESIRSVVNVFWVIAKELGIIKRQGQTGAGNIKFGNPFMVKKANDSTKINSTTESKDNVSEDKKENILKILNIKFLIQRAIFGTNALKNPLNTITISSDNSRFALETPDKNIFISSLNQVLDLKQNTNDGQTRAVIKDDNLMASQKPRVDSTYSSNETPSENKKKIKLPKIPIGNKTKSNPNNIDKVLETTDKATKTVNDISDIYRTTENLLKTSVKEQKEVFTQILEADGIKGISREGTFLVENNTFVSWGNDNFVKIWDLDKNKTIAKLKSKPYKEPKVKTEKKVKVKGEKKEKVKSKYDTKETKEKKDIVEIAVQTAKKIYNQSRPRFVEHVALSPDNKTLVSIDDDFKIDVWDLTPVVKEKKKKKEKVVKSGKKKKKEKAAKPEKKKQPKIQKKPIFSLGIQEGVSDFVFSNDGQYLITTSDTKGVKFWNINTKQIEKSYNFNAKKITLLPNNKYALSGNKIWNLETGKIEKTLLGFEQDLNKVYFDETGKTMLCGRQVWNVEEGKLVCFIHTIRGTTDYILYTEEGYYKSTRKGLESLHFLYNEEVYQFDQFDLQFNRPDIVLEKIGLAPEVAEAYEKAYQKRLRKLEVNPENFGVNFEFNAPKVIRLDSDRNFQEVKEKIFKFSIEAEDQKYKLDRLNLYVNGSPIYGKLGKDLKNKAVSKISQDLEVELASGDNIVEVSALNEKGVQSLMLSFKVKYEPAETPKRNLCLVSIGVNEYADKSQNLRNAQNDERTISQLFKSNQGKVKFDKIIHLSLENEEATLENFRKLKDTLTKSKVDDYLIISFSGHGVLDEEFNYYLAMYDMDFSNPKERGLLYDELEDLLGKVPARQKVLFIGACHSGEVDKEEVTFYPENSDSFIFEEVSSSSDNREEDNLSKLNLGNSFDIMQELFVDIRRNTGTVVLSAALGKQYANDAIKLRGADINNSPFTYLINEGMRKKTADANKDGIVMLSELMEYVIRTVPRLTGGKQQPTSRVENIVYDFPIW